MSITKRMIARWFNLGILDRAFIKKRTKKGAKHIHSEQFKSINHSGVSPAEYRHDHLVMRNGRLLKKAKKKKGAKS